MKSKDNPNIRDVGRVPIPRWMHNGFPQFEAVPDGLSSTKTLGSDFLTNCGMVAVPNFPWV